VICRIAGELLRVDDGAAEIRSGDLVYEVLVPAADEERLRERVGGAVEFHTLHYLEGQGQGTSFRPRLIGFGSPLERDFFELFTTVKGIGNRKALRALQMPFGMVAELIARRDVSMLTTLPEIGRKTAETIVVELKGRIDRFTVLGRGEQRAAPDRAGTDADGAPTPNAGAGAGAGARAGGAKGRSRAAAEVAGDGPTPGPAGPSSGAGATGTPLSDAIEVLVQLGETRVAARQLVERALDRDPAIRAADQLVAAALRAR